jgi:hypothetical protein
LHASLWQLVCARDDKYHYRLENTLLLDLDFPVIVIYPKTFMKDLGDVRAPADATLAAHLPLVPCADDACSADTGIN